MGNGGVTSTYHWTQSLYETTVYVSVPPGTRGKDIKCDIGTNKIEVRLKSAPDGDAPLLSGDFPYAVRTDESLWNLDSESHQVIITLDKTVRTWWDSVVKGDPKIDTSKVDSTMKIDEYDAETQGQIRKLMHDQRAQRLGQPTSNDILGIPQDGTQLLNNMPPPPTI